MNTRDQTSDAKQARRLSQSASKAGESGEGASAEVTRPLRLLSVMSPWHVRNAEQGTFEELVWATDDDDAKRALATRMAQCGDSAGDTDDEVAQWVDAHLDSTAHLMVVRDVSESLLSEIRELVSGPDGCLSTQAQEDYRAITTTLAKHLRKAETTQKDLRVKLGAGKEASIQLNLVSSENGFDDFDVIGHFGIRRMTVGHGIKNGDICNVYGPESQKRGAAYQGSPEATLAKFLGGARVAKVA